MGVRPTEKQLVSEVPAALAVLLDLPKGEVKIDRSGAPDADLLVRAGGYVFVVDVLDAAAPGPIVAHAERVVTAARKLRRKATPLLAVPFMTEAGRRACEGASVPW